jgi:hypothetical protein
MAAPFLFAVGRRAPGTGGGGAHRDRGGDPRRRTSCSRSVRRPCICEAASPRFCGRFPKTDA